MYLFALYHASFEATSPVQTEQAKNPSGFGAGPPKVAADQA
jgi:hypothetical protein